MPKLNPGILSKLKVSNRGRKLIIEFYPDDPAHNTVVNNEGVKPVEVLAWLNELAEYFIDKAKNKA